jgi:hypothetical protein
LDYHRHQCRYSHLPRHDHDHDFLTIWFPFIYFVFCYIFLLGPWC